MDINVIGQFVSSVGFPIFVAVWMLYKGSNDTKELEKSINKLENAILELTTYIKTLKEKENKKNED